MPQVRKILEFLLRVGFAVAAAIPAAVQSRVFLLLGQGDLP
jgi:hypothetical protein